jgi:threonine/homoserine/homoserine lactone efflux protein
MFEVSTLVIFAAASAALIAIPGPAVIYIVTRGLAQGRSAGVVSALGVEAGALLHVAAAAVGLSALVASSAVAFTAIKYAGAAYLILLGVRKLTKGGDLMPADPPRERTGRLFWQGLIVNALNPKVAIFFLAFLPQFIDPARGAVAVQVVVLGVFFISIAVALDCAWAVAAGTVGNGLRDSVAIRRWLNRVSGTTYVGLGVTAALARRTG